jgi:cytochrome c biogenesis protein CcdA/thiol-disulfide isomerase/thioredoxin
MLLFLISLFAGMLTVFAPCVFPLLPVVIGSSATGRSARTPYIVVASLCLSVVLFTYLLKASELLINVPQSVWPIISGSVLAFFGLTLIVPALWEKIPGISKLMVGANKLVGAGHQKKTLWGDIVIGAALGPVFSTCSPTYFLILSTVLPANWFLGTVYLFAYIVGLAAVLLPIAILGDRITRRFVKVADPKSAIRKVIGLLFILLGIGIALGYDKQFEAYALEHGFFDISGFEQRISQAALSPEKPSAAAQFPGTLERYKEIADPSGFVNTDGKPITIGEFIGKKVILLDVMTYSCINCQRTFPYVKAWYEKYKDDGLIVIGIHTPEFAFEKNIDNVTKAMHNFGITFPVVLDNDYGTWNAYGNQYWPRKYLIDINGNIAYDHIGEGGYDEIEKKIQELLAERKEALKEGGSVDTGLAAEGIAPVAITAQSPETYFGSARNDYLGNGFANINGTQRFATPDRMEKNTLYLDGIWTMYDEYAESQGETTVTYTYTAGDVYLVADADAPIEVEVMQDGVPVGLEAGADVHDGILTVEGSRLYKVIHNAAPGMHILELHVKKAGLRAYTFTFG